MLSLERPAYAGERFDLADFVDERILRQFGLRADSTGTNLFLRELTYIYEQTYDVKYPDLIARQILPVDTRVNPGAETFLWRQFDKKGTARIADPMSDDIPMAEADVGQEFQTRIFSILAGYQYTHQELRAASMSGQPLEMRKARQARRMVEQAIEQIAAFGVQAMPGGVQGAMYGIPSSISTTDYLANFGLTNFPGILNAYQSGTAQYPGQTIGAGTTTGQTSTNWVSAGTSVTSILADLNLMQRTMVVGSKGVHTPSDLLVGSQVWATLSTVARSPTFTDDSVLQFIKKQSPWIQSIRYWPMLDTAGLKQDNSTAGERVMLVERNADNFSLIVPQEFEQLPPQFVNLRTRIPCHARCGGVTVHYPFSIVFLDGAAG